MVPKRYKASELPLQPHGALGIVRAMSRARRLATAALVVLVTAATVWSVLMTGGAGWFDNLAVRALYDAVTIATLVSWLGISAFRPAWLPHSRMSWALAACLGAFVVSTATSRLPRMSLEMFAYAVLLAELYLLLVQLLRIPAVRRRLEALALLLALVATALYLLESVGAWITWWNAVGRIAVPPLRPGSLGLSLGSPNPVATLLLALGAFGAATVYRPTRPARAVVIVALLAVGTAALVSGSRGAWLGAAAGFVVTLAAAMALLPAVRAWLREARHARIAIPLAVLATALLVAGGVLAARSGRLSLEGASYREAFAAASLRMFAASPLTGVGPNTWQVLRAANTTSPEIDYYVPHAHDIYLMTLAEFGLVGLIAGVVVIATVAVLIVRALRSADPGRQRVGLASLFVVVMFAGQQLVDVLVNVPALMVAVALPIAWLDAADPGADRPGAVARRLDPASFRRRRMLAVTALVVTCGIAVGLGMVERVSAMADRAVAAGDAGNWSTATALAQQATAEDSGYPPYWFDLGVSAANAGDLSLAQRALSRSASMDDFTYAWLDLAAVRWRLGDDAGARTALAQAERLGWQRASVAFPAGWLREQLGDRAAAISDYAAALAVMPALAGDPYWTATASARAEWPAILEAAGRRLEGDGALQLELYAGQMAAAERLAVRLDGGGAGLHALVVQAWSGDQAARTQLTALAQRHPLDAGSVAWCEMIAVHLGDAQGEARFGTWLNVLSAGVAIPHVTLGRPMPMPDTGVDRYGALYRRPVTSEFVVGILPQLGIWG